MTHPRSPETPPREITWLCTARRAPIWVSPRNRPPYRPYLVLVLEQETDKIRRTHTQEEYPTPDEFLDQLNRAMGRTLLSLGRRITPTRVVLDDAELAQALAPRLAERGIRCEHRAMLPLVDAAWRELDARLNQREPLPGLLSVPGATVPLVQELFAAAAEYYRSAPWQWMESSRPIEVRYPPTGRARYALVLGSQEEVCGLSLYESIDDLRVLFACPEPEQRPRPLTPSSLVYDEAMGMAFDDLDAMERYGWPVAGERAYPVFVKVTEAGAFTVPNLSELLWLAAVLRTLPHFIFRHLHADEGSPYPAVATYPLSNIHGGQQIALRYPVPVFAEPIAPAELEAYIEQWYRDEPTHEFARQVGEFLFRFLDDLALTGLSETTMRKHSDNCWLIGKFLCAYGDQEVFSPAVFLGGPLFLAEFQRQVSEAPAALASYQTTWRRLKRYVRALGYGEHRQRVR